MLNLEQIKEFENTYTGNIDTVLYWDRQLMNQQNHDDWMVTVYRRSQAIRRTYLENQELLKNFLSMLNEEMNDEIREALFEMLLRLFQADSYDDIVVMEHIADALLPYYEQSGNDSHIIKLLNVKCVLTLECRYRLDRHTEKYHYNDIHGRLLSYIAKYRELESEDRRVLMVNFYNMVCCMPMILPHELNYALDIYDEFLCLIQEPAVRALDKDEALIQYRIRNISDGIWNIAEKLEYFDRPHLLHFYELLVDEYTKQKEKSDGKILNNLEAAYYYTSAYLTELGGSDTGISWQTAYEFLSQSAVIHLENLECMTVDTVDDNFLMNCYYPYQESTNYVFKIYQYIRDTASSPFMKDFIRRGTKVLEDLPRGKNLWLVYAIQAEWCENVSGILGDSTEQQEQVYRILVKGQIQTYIHSQMVALLAETILDHMISYQPELLLTLPHAKSVENVRKNRREFLRFIHQAAMYHDIGKSKIALIINQQTRALSNEEFSFIKQHPEHPETGVLKDQKNYYQYFDIIAGHHKSYDGKSGYPEYFDNVHSPYRILIDLITICDCIDAATDQLGRNYTGGKSFEKVMQELAHEKGTRYNPDIVDLMLSCAPLQEALVPIVGSGRDEVYYQTYKEYFS